MQTYNPLSEKNREQAATLGGFLSDLPNKSVQDFIPALNKPIEISPQLKNIIPQIGQTISDVAIEAITLGKAPTRTFNIFPNRFTGESGATLLRDGTMDTKAYNIYYFWGTPFTLKSVNDYVSELRGYGYEDVTKFVSPPSSVLESMRDIQTLKDPVGGMHYVGLRKSDNIMIEIEESPFYKVETQPSGVFGGSKIRPDIPTPRYTYDITPLSSDITPLSSQASWLSNVGKSIGDWWGSTALGKLIAGEKGEPLYVGTAYELGKQAGQRFGERWEQNVIRPTNIVLANLFYGSNPKDFMAHEARQSFIEEGPQYWLRTPEFQLVSLGFGEVASVPMFAERLGYGTALAKDLFRSTYLEGAESSPLGKMIAQARGTFATKISPEVSKVGGERVVGLTKGIGGEFTSPEGILNVGQEYKNWGQWIVNRFVPKTAQATAQATEIGRSGITEATLNMPTKVAGGAPEWINNLGTWFKQGNWVARGAKGLIGTTVTLGTAEALATGVTTGIEATKEATSRQQLMEQKDTSANILNKAAVSAPGAGLSDAQKSFAQKWGPFTDKDTGKLNVSDEQFKQYREEFNAIKVREDAVTQLLGGYASVDRNGLVSVDTAAMIKDLGENEAYARLASAGFQPTISQVDYDALDSDSQKLYTRSKYGDWGVVGRGFENVFPGPQINWLGEKGLLGQIGGGVLSLTFPQYSAQQLYQEKGAGAYSILLPGLGPTWGQAALTYQEVPWWQTALNVGFGAAYLAAPFAGAAWQTSGAASWLGRNKVLGPLGRFTAKTIEAPYRIMEYPTKMYGRGYWEFVHPAPTMTATQTKDQIQIGNAGKSIVTRTGEPITHYVDPSGRAYPYDVSRGALPIRQVIVETTGGPTAMQATTGIGTDLIPIRYEPMAGKVFNVNRFGGEIYLNIKNAFYRPYGVSPKYITNRGLTMGPSEDAWISVIRGQSPIPEYYELTNYQPKLISGGVEKGYQGSLIPGYERPIGVVESQGIPSEIGQTQFEAAQTEGFQDEQFKQYPEMPRLKADVGYIEPLIEAPKSEVQWPSSELSAAEEAQIILTQPRSGIVQVGQSAAEEAQIILMQPRSGIVQVGQSADYGVTQPVPSRIRGTAKTSVNVNLPRLSVPGIPTWMPYSMAIAGPSLLLSPFIATPAMAQQTQQIQQQQQQAQRQAQQQQAQRQAQQQQAQQMQQQMQQLQQMQQMQQQMQQLQQMQQNKIVQQNIMEQNYSQPAIQETTMFGGFGEGFSGGNAMIPPLVPPLPSTGMTGGSGGGGGQPPSWLIGRGWVIPAMILSLPEPFSMERIRLKLSKKKIKPYGARIGTSVSRLKEDQI
jgi:hypothetical protein